MKTKKQKEIEKTHNRLIQEYHKLNAEWEKTGGSRMVMVWDKLEKTSGLSRPYIYTILTKNGIDYKINKNNEQAGN